MCSQETDFLTTDGSTFPWTGLNPGDYEVFATDANGCVAEVGFILQEPDPLVFEVETTPVGCDGADGACLGLGRPPL